MRAMALDRPLPATREARFAEFVEANRDAAVRTAWRLTGEDQGVAEEVAQDAFVRAWNALPGFREEAQLSTWFYRILVRTCANRRRWKGLRDRWTTLWDGDLPGPSHARGDPGLRGAIDAAMQRLTDNQREAFTLVHLEGFTIREAAEITGRAPGTIKSHLHRALRSLRADLETVHEELSP